VSRAWERFFFAPHSVAPLVLVRVAYGCVLVAWTLSLAPDVSAFFSDRGLIPQPPPLAYGAWDLLHIVDSPVAAWTLWAVLLVAGGCIVIGWHTRLAAFAGFVVVTSFERRNFGVFNAGDGLIRILAAYLMLSHAGAAVSLDSRRAGRDPWEFVHRPAWALRLMQIQLSVIYLASVAEKLSGSTWRHGTALSFALRLDDLHRLPLPAGLADQSVIVGMGTFAALAVEIAVPICVWIPRLRLPAMLAGVALHVGIAYSMRVGFFGAIMLTLYLAFVSPRAAERLLLAVRDRLLRTPHAGRKKIHARARS
jgi:hypothetical protein